MSHITFVTGGQRSGKSSYALRLAEERASKPVYLATAQYWDDEFSARIHRHQADRGAHWETIEEQIEISKHVLNKRTVLLDCITLWLTNIFYANDSDLEKSLSHAQNEWAKFLQNDFSLIIVSNEIGMGVIPHNEMVRKFCDLQGWMNQHIATNADKVVLMVSGLPLVVR